MSVSILMVRALVEALERVGVPRDRLLIATDLDPLRLDEYSARLPAADYDRIQIAAVELSRDEAFGLHLGEQATHTSFGLLGNLTVHATTLRQGIEGSIRYQCLLNDSLEPVLREEGEVASVRYPFPQVHSISDRLSSELAMTGLLRLIRMFVGPHARPRGVFFAHEAPAYRAEYRRIFGGAEHFGHAFTGIEFERTWLARTQLFKNPELYAVLQRQAERSIGRLTRDGNMSELIQEHLASRDPREMPSMEDVARHLGMSARSLRRRLVAEGSEYKDLIARARTRIAKRLLEHPRASIHEIAYAMGFATPAAFHRAFKRWTGMTPNEYKSSY